MPTKIHYHRTCNYIHNSLYVPSPAPLIIWPCCSFTFWMSSLAFQLPSLSTPTTLSRKRCYVINAHTWAARPIKIIKKCRKIKLFPRWITIRRAHHFTNLIACTYKHQQQPKYAAPNWMCSSMCLSRSARRQHAKRPCSNIMGHNSLRLAWLAIGESFRCFHSAQANQNLLPRIHSSHTHQNRCVCVCVCGHKATFRTPASAAHSSPLVNCPGSVNVPNMVLALWRTTTAAISWQSQ